MDSLKEQVKKAKEKQEKVAEENRWLFPEFHALKQAEAKLIEAKKEYEKCKEQWDKIVGE